MNVLPFSNVNVSTKKQNYNVILIYYVIILYKLFQTHWGLQIINMTPNQLKIMIYELSLALH